MEEDEGGSSLYQAQPESVERTDRDLFRKKEKAVKDFMKRIEEEIDSKLRKKRNWKSSNATPNEAAADMQWSEVVDVHAEHLSPLLTLVSSAASCCSELPHSCSCTESKIYKLSASCGGFYIVKNALCPQQQLLWAKKAVEDYSRAEHTNLSNLARQKYEEMSEESKGSVSLDDLVESDLWGKSATENNNFQSFKKLRWSCLGYHYDWTQRSYQKNLKSFIPEDFAVLCKSVSNKVGTDLIPEAAIINFYPLNSTMGGHLDDAEHNLERPIVSFSLGRSAVFLIGGKTKLEETMPIMLKSGDAIVMSGESRLCYHGVPSIIPEGVEIHLTGQSGTAALEAAAQADQEAYQHVVEYLKGNRVNMNSRQVRLGEEWVEKAGTGCVKV